MINKIKSYYLIDNRLTKEHRLYVKRWSWLTTIFVGLGFAYVLLQNMYEHPTASIVGTLIPAGLGCLIFFLIIKRSLTNIYLIKALNQKTENTDFNEKKPNASSNHSFLLALEEYESENKDKGLWAKCFAESNGDENFAKAKYLTIRAEILEKNEGQRAELKEAEISNGRAGFEDASKDFFEYSIKENDLHLYPSSYLIKNKLYEINLHKDHEYMILKNGNAAIKFGDTIYVYFNEADLIRALKTSYFNVGRKQKINIHNL